MSKSYTTLPRLSAALILSATGLLWGSALHAATAPEPNRLSAIPAAEPSSDVTVPSAAPVDNASPEEATTTESDAPAESAAEDSTPAQNASGNEIEEIFVTAQRKNESLSETPVAVSVITAETLANAQIITDQDLQIATPGLSVRSSRSSNQLNYSLRGQSQDPFSSTRPGVLAYFNEVQIGGQGTSTAFYDLQSVQVLKGPQGTLFGRSATGGAVLFTSAKPTDYFTGYLSAMNGNYDARKYEAAASGPIAGNALMGRIAGFAYERTGFQKNLYDDKTTGDIDRKGFRVSLTGNLDSLHNDLVVDYFHADGKNTLGILSGILPPAAPGQPPYIPMALLYSGIATPADRSRGIGILQALVPSQSANAAAFYDAYFADPRNPAGGVAGEIAAQKERGPYVVNSNGLNSFLAKNTIISNTTGFDLNENTQIKNVFGYADLKTTLSTDYDGTPYGLQGNSLPTIDVTEQTTEELQLLGKLFENKLSYVAGLYYGDQKQTYNSQSSFFDLLYGGRAQTNALETISKTKAVYAQGTYLLNDEGLSATLGTRYTSEKVEKHLLPTDSARIALGEPAPPGFSYDKDKTYQRTSWQLGLQDQLSRELLIYGVTRRAYKSGGFNGFQAPRDGTAETAGDSYGAEQVTDVELGSKYFGLVNDMPIRANIAAYHNWVSDAQRVAYAIVASNPAALTVNVPRAKIYGLELDGQIKPIEWLTLGATYNYTHARYTDGDVIVLGAPQLYDRVTDTPKMSGTIFGDVNLPVSGNLSATLHADLYGQSRTYIAPRSANSDGTIIDSYNLLNLRVALENVALGWSLIANLKNATDKVYYTGGFPLGEINQINTLVPGEPRTFTVEARYKF